MSGKSANSTKNTETVLKKNINIPVKMTDSSLFDDAYAFMKERFAAEMRRVDEEMTKFSTDLMHLYGQTTTVHAGMTSSQRENSRTNWETITSSPLVEDVGDNKVLKLQFDVSQFDPDEVTVKILNDVLIVSAAHQQKTNSSTVLREYNREFLLPAGTDPEAVVSSLSKEGVLTVQAPLPHPIIDDTTISRSSLK